MSKVIALCCAMFALSVTVSAQTDAPDSLEPTPQSVPTVESIPFSGLTQQEQRLLNQQRKRWDDLPAQQQRKLRDGAQRWLSMSPQQRRSARNRWQQWQDMSEERRQNLRKKLRDFRSLTPQQRQRLRRNYRNFRQLPEARQRALRQQWQQLPADERAQIRRDIQREKKRSQQNKRFSFGLSDIERAQVRKAVNKMDMSERRALRQRLKAASKEERRKILKDLANE